MHSWLECYRWNGVCLCVLRRGKIYNDVNVEVNRIIFDHKLAILRACSGGRTAVRPWAQHGIKGSQPIEGNNCGLFLSVRSIVHTDIPSVSIPPSTR
jgi:hypothetical protein